MWRSIVLSVRPSSAVGEVGFRHSQAAGMLVHQIDEGVFIAGHMFSQCDAGVVTRLDNHTFE